MALKRGGADALAVGGTEETKALERGAQDAQAEAATEANKALKCGAEDAQMEAATAANKAFKRGADDAQAEVATEESKRFRSALEEMADEFICPITHDLPLDPVMAEDGKVYERKAIALWLQRRSTSPLTNQPMEPRLLEARHVRNAIEKLVRSGGIDGEKAERWRQRLQDEAEVVEVRQRAEGGDAEALYKLGTWYREGEKGLQQDAAAAYYWEQRSADLGHVAAMAHAGTCLVHGLGVAQNQAYGICQIGGAAHRGSDLAAYVLGLAHSRGLYGLPKNVALAKDWLGKVVSGSCPVKHLSPDFTKCAAWKLEALTLQQQQLR